MNLAEVWDFLRPEVKRSFRAVAGESPRVDTPRLLGALLRFRDRDGGARLLAGLEDSVGERLIHPADVPEETEPCPEELELSPTVHETLNFFRIHSIRDVSIARLALRLLQIGSGELVRDLEAREILPGILADLEEEVRAETSS